MTLYSLKLFIKRLFVFLILSASAISSQHSHFQFKNLSIEHGLSQSVVVSLYKDSRGFIWIGTQDGLNRYDGHKFVIYRNNLFDKNSISNNYISAIDEDKQGNIWAATGNGSISKYERHTGNFKSFYTTNENVHRFKYFLRSILIDKNGFIWTGGAGSGLLKFDSDGKLLNTFKSGGSFSSIANDSINTIYEDKQGNIWVGTASGLSVLKFETGEWKSYKKKRNEPSSISDNFIRCILEDNSGNLWIGTDKGGLNKFNPSMGTFKAYSYIPNKKNWISGNSINSLAAGSDGYIWIGIWGGGLNMFNPVTENFFVIKNNPGEPPKLPTNDINTVYEDKNGVLWIGSYGSGIISFNTNFSPFLSIDNKHFSNINLNNQIINAIHKDKNGNLWIGTWSGLILLDAQKKNSKIFKKTSTDSSGITDNRITAIAEDKNGNIWIGTLDGGLNKFDIGTGKFFKYKHQSSNANSIPSNKITSLIFDRHGILWIATAEQGVTRFNTQTGIFNKLNEYPAELLSVPNNWINSLFEDKDGNIWISSVSGLIKLNTQTKTYEHYTLDYSTSESLSSNWINSVFQSRNGSIWIATMQGGLNKLYYKNGKGFFKKYLESDGLPNNNVYRLLEDENGFLWISTNYGLSKFDPDKNIFKNYDRADGLRSNEFKNGAYYDETSKTMYFGGIYGVNYFRPSQIPEENESPKVVLTSFKIFNKEVQPGDNSPLENSIDETGEVNLSYSDYLFSIEFAALNTPNPEKIKYAYKLEGFDKEWNYTDSKLRMASYTNLDGGSYIFKVAAVNNIGSGKENATTLIINIKPPFWFTWWFKTIAAFFVLVTTWSIYQIRTKSIRESNKILEEKVRRRTQELIEANNTKDRFFSIIAHDLKNPFTVLFGYTDMMDKGIDNMTRDEVKEITSSIRTSASKVYSLLENLLEWAQLQLGGIKAEPANLYLKFLSDSSIYTLSDNAKQKKITIKNRIPDECLVYADESMIKTVLRNLISNAIKFTKENGSIILDAIPEDGMYRISIQDDGVGMSKEQIMQLSELNLKITSKGTGNETGTGLGFILCRDFVEQNSGKIFIESQLDKGTKITFTLPIGK